jgi:hypothetical protein
MKCHRRKLKMAVGVMAMKGHQLMAKKANGEMAKRNRRNAAAARKRINESGSGENNE